MCFCAGTLAGLVVMNKKQYDNKPPEGDRNVLF